MRMLAEGILSTNAGRKELVYDPDGVELESVGAQFAAVCQQYKSGMLKKVSIKNYIRGPKGCNCRAGCKSMQCPCKKALVHCTSSCHVGLACANK